MEPWIFINALNRLSASQEIPPHFMEPQIFINALTRARHLSLSLFNS